MANPTRAYFKSFGGGEISPFMYGRIDDSVFQAGAARLRNFIVTPQGPAENRPGFAYVNEVKDSAKRVRLIPFTFSTTQTMVIELGAGYIRFHSQGGTLESTPGTPYEISNSYVEADLQDIHYVQSADVLTFVHPGYAPMELRRLGALSWTLTAITFTPTIAPPSSVSAVASGHTAVKYTYYYVVTAFADDGFTESVKSSAASAAGNLYETGAIVTISWGAVSGASRYRVYKLQGGLYGYIGETESTSVIDDNIAPDMSTTPPIYDTVFNGAGDYPGAVSYFEQRRVFAGTTNDPQEIWMTKSGTESNFSYSLPIKSDDRIDFRVAAREANTIRHIVPLSELLLLTSAAEWRVTSVNSDAITPTSFSVKPQSYIGASNVQPQIVNNTLVYCASRGGHIRELGFSYEANGFITGDLSLRAAHLFDTFEIGDMAYSKAPYPVVWFISNNGKLLGLTYIPEQKIGAWHWHDTLGEFESCCVVAEEEEDVLYVVVKRDVNGSEVRYIERMASRIHDNLEDYFFVDSGATYDGANTGSTTMTLSGGTSWGPDETLTLTASAATFSDPGDIGDVVAYIDTDGAEYRATIESVTSTTVAVVRVDKVVPTDLRNVAVASWAFARNVVSGINWLEGETVSILADGAVRPQQVVTSGTITLARPASKVHVGLPYQADIQTLPLAMQIEGYGQGRQKNINKAWLRVFKSSGIFVGPDEDQLVEAKQRSTEPYGSAPALKSQEIEVVLTPSWRDSGQVYIRQDDPLPLTVVGLTLEVSIGA
jgi:hypothetical protein